MTRLIALLILLAAPAAAQQCAPVDKAIAHHAMNGQQVDGLGVGQNGRSYMVLVDWQTGDWSIVRISAKGIACKMAQGTDWTVDRTPPGGKM